MTRMLDRIFVDELASTFRGPVLTRGGERYQQARHVDNAMIDKRPALIACCRDVADVRAAVDLRRQSGLDIAVRGGGHHGPGLGTVDGGLVIDLGAMNGVLVDPEKRPGWCRAAP